MFNLLNQIKSRLDALDTGGAGGTTDIQPALDAIAALDARVQNLSLASGGLPTGWVQAFRADAIPAGFVPLDGGFLAVTANPALYGLLGDAYSNSVDETTLRATAVHSVPQMTSNTAPSGVASASSQYDADTYAAWRAFDRVTNAAVSTNGWLMATGVKTGWLQYAYPEGISKHLVAYAIRPRINGSDVTAPTDWVMQGSADGVTWDDLDARAGISGWSDGQRRFYELDLSATVAAYRYMRLTISASNAAGSFGGLNELELHTVDSVPYISAPDGHFGLPNMASSPTPLPGGVWCIKAG
ncbi:MAG: tail fiber protein [Pseudomonadota bacterium]